MLRGQDQVFELKKTCPLTSGGEVRGPIKEEGGMGGGGGPMPSLLPGEGVRMFVAERRVWGFVPLHPVTKTNIIPPAQHPLWQGGGKKGMKVEWVCRLAFPEREHHCSAWTSACLCTTYTTEHRLQTLPDLPNPTPQARQNNTKHLSSSAQPRYHSVACILIDRP